MISVPELVAASSMPEARAGQRPPLVVLVPGVDAEPPPADRPGDRLRHESLNLLVIEIDVNVKITIAARERAPGA